MKGFLNSNCIAAINRAFLGSHRTKGIQKSFFWIMRYYARILCYFLYQVIYWVYNYWSDLHRGYTP